MTKYDTDVVVVGLGAMGAMALWRLAARGVDAIGIEQFDIAHDRGSSFGSTRLFRLACFEHPDLGTMALRARDLWRELEDVSNTELLTLTGGVMIGPPDSDLIAGTRQAAARAGSPVDELSRDDVISRFPAHASMERSYVGLWDPGAGVVRPEAAITAAVAAAEALGATIFPRTTVTSITESADGVEVQIDGRMIRARAVVVASGPWAAKLLGLPDLRATRTVMTWFKSQGQDMGVNRMPVFIRHVDDERTFWGHGEIDGLPIKVGAPDDAVNTRPTDPDEIDREISDADIAGARIAVGRYLDGIDPEPVKAYACMITFSPDHQFVLGPREQGSRVIIGSGDSGHAFKHASAIGDFLAGSALGEPAGREYDFVSPDRFALAH